MLKKSMLKNTIIFCIDMENKSTDFDIFAYYFTLFNKVVPINVSCVDIIYSEVERHEGLSSVSYHTHIICTVIAHAIEPRLI